MNSKTFLVTALAAVTVLSTAFAFLPIAEGDMVYKLSFKVGS
jgi:hypothetical protein